MMITNKIVTVVDMIRRLDELFPSDNTTNPHSFMIAKYALKQLIYELQKREKSD